MFDLGRTLLAVVERSPDALAIVDGERRLSYAAWYREIGRVGGGLTALGSCRTGWRWLRSTGRVSSSGSS
jgi:2-furoate---CoA ligase